MKKIEEHKELQGTTYTFCLELDDENLLIKDIRVGASSIMAIFPIDELQLAYNEFYHKYINREA